MTPIESMYEAMEPEPLIIRKRWFYRMAQYDIFAEHIYKIEPRRKLLEALKSRKVDLFTFIERTFIESSTRRDWNVFYFTENIGLLRIASYEEWFKLQTTQRVRQYIKKANRMIEVRLVNIDEAFIKGAFRIYNETPIRQGRKYSGYGLSLTQVRAKFSNMSDSEVLGAYLDDQLIGFFWVGYGDRVASLKSFLSLMSYRNKYPNNALLAGIVKRCCEKGYRFLTYANMGYNPGLDYFKQTNGFRICPVPRYYLPLSARGQLAIRLKLYQPVEHSFSPTMTRALVPLYNRLNRFLPANSNDHANA